MIKLIDLYYLKCKACWYILWWYRPANRSKLNYNFFITRMLMIIINWVKKKKIGKTKNLRGIVNRLWYYHGFVQSDLVNLLTLLFDRWFVKGLDLQPPAQILIVAQMAEGVGQAICQLFDGHTIIRLGQHFSSTKKIIINNLHCKDDSNSLRK